MGNFNKWLKSKNLKEELASGTQSKVNKADGYFGKVADSVWKNAASREQALTGVFNKILSALNVEQGDAMKAKSKLKMDVERILTSIVDAATAKNTGEDGSNGPLGKRPGANVGSLPGAKQPSGMKSPMGI